MAGFIQWLASFNGWLHSMAGFIQWLASFNGWLYSQSQLVSLQHRQCSGYSTTAQQQGMLSLSMSVLGIA
jgi:hypothetical protein